MCTPEDETLMKETLKENELIINSRGRICQEEKECAYSETLALRLDS